MDALRDCSSFWEGQARQKENCVKLFSMDHNLNYSFKLLLTTYTFVLLLPAIHK